MYNGILNAPLHHFKTLNLENLWLTWPMTSWCGKHVVHSYDDVASVLVYRIQDHSTTALCSFIMYTAAQLRCVFFLCTWPLNKMDWMQHTHTLGTACDDFGIIYYVPHFTIFYPCFLANINWTLNCLDVMDHAGQIQPQTRRKINHQKTTTVLFQWVVYILKTVNKHACTCTHWSFNIDNHSELRKHFKIIHPIVLGDGSSKERQLVHVHIIQMNHPHSWGVCFFFVRFSWFGMLAPTLFQ